ncbi:hypothetical protein DRB17_13225 [Ferruginivarius sediminum]|uniref:L-lactate permease n=2 Tax=Ferruginivarius sediminum TaxID=2661937 RepID=A0A369T7Y9_9PROT|nr:hypothetical protein DRB17_13225 [Ferruginivarius sediminum]
MLWGYAAPTVLVIVLLASRQVSSLTAGIAGLAATIPPAVLALPDGQGTMAVLALESGKGAWLAWHAIAVILAGLFFHEVGRIVTRQRGEDAASTEYSHRRLFAACFLLGPFFEAAVGFGVGLVIVVPTLLRLGLAPIWAAVFGLYSQAMVPWGAMAIGSTVGAGLAGLPADVAGVATVAVEVPVLVALLLAFWWLVGRIGARPGLNAILDDVGWLAAICAGLYLTNRYIALESGAIVTCGILLPLRFFRDERPDLAAWQSLIARAAPYLALTGLVLLTRAAEPVEAWLRAASTLQPFADSLGFALLHHVSVLILVVAIGNGLAHGLGARLWREAAVAAWRAAWRPAAVTLVFVVMGRLTGASGMAGAMTETLVAAAGGTAVLASPAMGGLAGFLTGSNVASNAIMMPLQAQIAAHTGHPLTWLAAIQIASGNALTMFSPIRIAMGAALIGQPGGESEIYRRSLPMAAAVAAALFAFAAGVWALAG